jgi:hypothetical protein
MSSGTTTYMLRGVGGTGSSDAWIVGNAGTILHWDGTSWTTVPSGTPNDLYAVSGALGAIRALGADGTVLRRQ